ncbi:dihydrolipoyl dehydrogenase family protein [Streptomyces sp. HB2AG]|uniref:dihydrolipoyl dehydrogenase family protein n=1 Tax=Streptomyces sp. HB2AG TaxID=2983400 RepID=UPI0022AA3C86|nr:NAD(P)/FAD-dependent oxidoreductase [Streptomyces sp. HB2AG]MCZ2526928.1 NAD(P)/FAD-dependent oxidoreductase [Streptomyces sp. HB2AG]
MTAQTLVDAVVVGLGPGGEETAGLLGEAGWDVAGVEARLVGGECPYWGCVPSKTMVRAAGLLADGRRIPGMAGTAMVHPEYGPVARAVRRATAGWDDAAAVERLTVRGVRVLRGTGRLTGRDEVTVTGSDGSESVLRASRAIVLAVGGEPVVPAVPGLPATPFWTSREAVEATAAPESLLVLGGGSVGLEIGQAFGRFGTAVAVVEGAPRLLPREEPEAGDLLMRVLTEDGLEVHTGNPLTGVDHSPKGFTAWCERGERLTAERLLVAVGRRVDPSRLGVGVLDVDPDVPALPVDDRMRVVPPARGVPGVWAVGDATGRGAYTHLALRQASVAVGDILGAAGGGAAGGEAGGARGEALEEIPVTVPGAVPAAGRSRAEYHAVPRVTFTDPEIGAVGRTEAEARERGLPVRTGFADVATSARGRIHRVGNAGFVKLVADTDEGVLVGATAAGPCGGEVLGALTVAVHARVPLETLRATVWAYPTFHRVIGAALEDLGP